MAHESITDKLRAILNIKDAIKAAIIFKGVEIKDSTLFEDYAQAIRNIEGGGTVSGGVVSFFQPETDSRVRVVGVISNVTSNKQGSNIDIDEPIPEPFPDEGFDW